MPAIISSGTDMTEFRTRRVKNISLYIAEKVLQDIIVHADSDGNEVMGLLTGYVFKDDDGMYATVDGTITSPLVSDRTSVRFDMSSPERLLDSIDDGCTEFITGWYHSHPGLGCFMSETDMKTHKGIFGSDCGFAIVIDPKSKEIKAFDASGEVRFVVME